MDNLSISAASGLRSRMESLDLLANNLANIDTGGYKADREFYSLFTGADATGDSMTGEMPTLPVVESQWIDHAQGSLINTANPLDLAIDGDGYFSVQTSSGVRYTRNGSFRISRSGTLSTGDGNDVRSRTGAPIPLDQGVAFSVTSDGTVMQAGQPAGQIDLASFEPRSLTKMGTNYYVPVEGATPKPADGTVAQGKLEQSNVGAAESSVRLVAIMRQFEMLQKALSIGNDLNRKAIEEVARVSN